MRVVGYVRDASAASDEPPAFAQGEDIRRWVAAHGHRLIATCQDVAQPGHELGRDGYKALVGIVRSGQADAVLVSSLTTLSPDKVTQEVMIWELRSRGVSVLSTEEADLVELSDEPTEQIRLIVRTVLAKAEAHLELVADVHGPGDLAPEGGPAPLPDEATAALDQVQEIHDDENDVVIELIPPQMRDVGGIRPAR